jgi:hypothetical protein
VIYDREYRKMQKRSDKCLSLMLAMLHEYFEPLQAGNVELKVDAGMQLIGHIAHALPRRSRARMKIYIPDKPSN